MRLNVQEKLFNRINFSIKHLLFAKDAASII